MTKESDVKTAVKKYLTSLGAYRYMPVPMGYGAATVDFLVCHKGRFYAIETKRPGVVGCTVRQQATLKLVQLAGGTTIIENDPEIPLIRQLMK